MRLWLLSWSVTTATRVERATRMRFYSKRVVDPKGIVNPKTGKRIQVGGPTHRKLLETGEVEGVGELPRFEEFLYVRDKDIWVRKVGSKYDALVKGPAARYVHPEGSRLIVRKDQYNSGGVGGHVTPLIPSKVRNAILAHKDILSVILSIACKGDLLTYTRLTLVCRRFHDVLSERAPFRSLVRARRRGRDNSPILNNKLVRYCRKSTTLSRVVAEIARQCSSVLVKDLLHPEQTKSNAVVAAKLVSTLVVTSASERIVAAISAELCQHSKSLVPWEVVAAFLRSVELDEELAQTVVHVRRGYGAKCVDSALPLSVLALQANAPSRARLLGTSDC
jgi:hypothetical protein